MELMDINFVLQAAHKKEITQRVCCSSRQRGIEKHFQHRFEEPHAKMALSLLDTGFAGQFGLAKHFRRVKPGKDRRAGASLHPRLERVLASTQPAYSNHTSSQASIVSLVIVASSPYKTPAFGPFQDACNAGGHGGTVSHFWSLGL